MLSYKLWSWMPYWTSKGELSCRYNPTLLIRMLSFLVGLVGASTKANCNGVVCFWSMISLVSCSLLAASRAKDCGHSQNVEHDSYARAANSSALA